MFSSLKYAWSECSYKHTFLNWVIWKYWLQWFIFFLWAKIYAWVLFEQVMLTPLEIYQKTSTVSLQQLSYSRPEVMTFILAFVWLRENSAGEGGCPGSWSQGGVKFRHYNLGGWMASGFCQTFLRLSVFIYRILSSRICRYVGVTWGVNYRTPKAWGPCLSRLFSTCGSVCRQSFSRWILHLLWKDAILWMGVSPRCMETWRGI